MPDIFLSYSRDDSAIARRFADGLKREGFDVWWDQTLHSGDPYDRITEQALKDSRAAVVLWSRNSVESRWVRAEAAMADRRGTLVPVMIGPCDRPLMFELTQAADLTRWKGNPADPAWRAFVEDVRRFVAGNSSSPPVSTPAAGHQPAGWRALLRNGVIAGVLLLVGAAGWLLLPRPPELAGGRAAASATSVIKGPVSVAVLPFVDMTSQGADAPLAEGLSEEISNWLAQIPDLHVVARTSAFMFKGVNQDLRKVGRELDATHLVEGSIRRGGDMVRVTVQLVAAADGYHVWSRTFDLPDTNVLRIEDAVSRAVAEALNARLTDETERRWKARQASVPHAHDLYLRGRAEQRYRTAESNLLAMDLYRRAIAEDPGFALPYVGLAEATLNSVPLNGREPSAVAPEVEALLDRADALSADLPEAIAARGWLAMAQYRNEDALALMQRAVSLNRNDADTQRRLGDLYGRLTQPRLAAERYALAASLDPMDFMTQVNRCFSLQDIAEYTAAEDACARARALGARNAWGSIATAYLEYGRGSIAPALRWLEEAIEVAPDMAWLTDNRVSWLMELGREEEALAVVSRLPDSAGIDRDFLTAQIAATRGDRAGLAASLQLLEGRAGGFGVSHWLALARLQLVGGDATAAGGSLDRARALPDWQVGALTEPDYVCQGAYSGAIIVSGVEMARGNRDAAVQLLEALDGTLDGMERGGAQCAGLYSLRAESQAMRGNPSQAMAWLRQAHDRGWRQARSARMEPYLQALRERPDFHQLLATTEQELREQANLMATAR